MSLAALREPSGLRVQLSEDIAGLLEMIEERLLKSTFIHGCKPDLEMICTKEINKLAERQGKIDLQPQLTWISI